MANSNSSTYFADICWLAINRRVALLCDSHALKRNDKFSAPPEYHCEFIFFVGDGAWHAGAIRNGAISIARLSDIFQSGFRCSPMAESLRMFARRERVVYRHGQEKLSPVQPDLSEDCRTILRIMAAPRSASNFILVPVHAQRCNISGSTGMLSMHQVGFHHHHPPLQ